MAQKGLRSQFLIVSLVLCALVLALSGYALFVIEHLTDLPPEQIAIQKPWHITMLTVLSAIAVSICGGWTWVVRRRLTGQFYRLVQRLSESAIIVSSASDSILQNSQNLAHKAAEQAGTLQATSASVEKIDRMIQENAKGARMSSSVSNTNYETAAGGKKSVETMVQSIKEIRDSNLRIAQAVEQSNLQFVQIVDAINLIAEKTKVINDIVFQTKILSFNASVEAARAGEHGRGFSVVAQEVGNLAILSGKAAAEIRDLLESSTHRVQQVVDQTRNQVSGLVSDANRKITTGSNIAVECDHALAKIVQDSTELRQLLTQISAACDDQASNAQMVTASMLQLDITTVDNFHAVKMSEQTAADLLHQANDLREIVDLLKKSA